MEAEYRLVVPFETKFVTIDAMVAHQRAVVFGLGKAELGEPGSVTVIPVLVMAEDSSQLLYRISVLRQLEEGDPEEEELLDGEREELPPRLWWEEYPQGILLRFGGAARRGGGCPRERERERERGGEEQAVRALCHGRSFSQSSFAGLMVGSGGGGCAYRGRPCWSISIPG